MSDIDEISFSKHCPIIMFIFNCYMYILAITTALAVYVDTYKSCPYSAIYVCLLSISYATAKFITHHASKFMWRMLCGRWIRPCLKDNTNNKINDEFDYICCKK